MNYDMRNDSILKKFIRFIVALLAFLAVVVPILFRTGVDETSSRLIKLDDGWTVAHNDRIYENIRVDELKLPLVSQGDVVQMSCTLPENADLLGATLSATCHNSAVEILVDEQMIYSYGMDLYAQKQFLGSGTHQVTLPNDYFGKQLEIRIYVGERAAFSTLATPVIGTPEDITKHTIGANRAQLAVSLFLIVFGLMLGIITLVMLPTQWWFFRLFAIAMFSILVGCWTMCCSNLMQFFVDSLVVKGWFEYMCVYVLPLPFLAYYYETITDKENPGLIRILYYTMFIGQIVLIGAALALQLTDTLHFPRLLPIAHVMMSVDIILIIVFVIRNSITKPRENLMHILSMGLIDLFVVFELLHYNLNKYLFGMPNGSYNSTICYGAMLVVFALMVDCCSDIGNTILRQAKESVFEQMAYTDELTGLRNRRYFDQEIQKVAKAGGMFGVVSMDMNHLKYMNDTYGHDMGDEALIQFSRILEQVFSEDAILCRIGGDEFNVLINNANDFSFEAKQELLMKKLNQWNAKSQSILLSTAVGYATRADVDKEEDEWEVCRVADSRMYECKRAQKQIDFPLK